MIGGLLSLVDYYRWFVDSEIERLRDSEIRRSLDLEVRRFGDLEIRWFGDSLVRRFVGSEIRRKFCNAVNCIAMPAANW